MCKRQVASQEPKTQRDLRAVRAIASVVLGGSCLSCAEGLAPKHGPRRRPALMMREGALPDGGDALRLRAQSA